MQRVFRVVETRTLRPSGAKTTSRFNRSVQRYGVLTPILLAEVPDGDGVLQPHIIDGNRRVRAALAERLPRVPAVVLKATSAKDRARLTLICNYLRSNNFHTESSAILALAQDDEDAEQVAGALGLGVVKMRQLFQKIDRMPEPVRRAMHEHRLPVTAAQWVSAWPEGLQQQACELVDRRKYVPVKEFKRLRERYELEHPEAFGLPANAEAEAAIEPFVVTEVWIDPPPVTPDHEALHDDLPIPASARVPGPPVPVERADPVVPGSPTPEMARVDPSMDGPGASKAVGSRVETACEQGRDSQTSPALMGGLGMAGASETRATPAGPDRPVESSPPPPAAATAHTDGPAIPTPPAEPASVAGSTGQADDVHAFVRRLDGTLLDLAREAQRRGIARAAWVDRTLRAWERAEGG